MIEYLIISFIFAVTLSTIVGVGWYMAHKKGIRTLVQKIDSEGAATAPQDSHTAAGRLGEVTLKLVHKLGNLVKPGREEDISHMRRRFLQAGWRDRRRNTMVLFYGSKVLLGAALPVCFLILKILMLKSIAPLHVMGLFLALGLTGFYLPEFWLAIKIAQRKETIVRGFADAMDLMVICTEAGMGLDAAIARVGEESRLTNPPLSDELRFLNLEMRAGKSRRDALKALAMRTGVQDIENFVTLLVQTDKFGTSVARALRTQADSMRVRRSQKVEELAAKLPVKLIFPTTLFIFPSMFLVLGGPALIQAFRAWTK